MMHHHNMHHQGVGGHPQHLNHHSLPGHHQIPPHQIHRDQNRLLAGPGPSGGATMGMGLGPAGSMPHCPPPRPMHHNPLSAHPPRHNPPPPSLQPHQQPALHPSHHGTHPALRCSLQPHQQVLRPTCTRPPAPPRHLVHAPLHAAPLRLQRPGVLVTMGQPPPPRVEPELAPSPSASSGTITVAPAPAEQPSPRDEVIRTDIILPDILADTSGGSANNKEKTPMCLVNELARFNKIKHQYRLTSEQGPAHRKRFTVALRLGGGEGEAGADAASTLAAEEYSAEGSRIRAAQHAVAAEALRRTAFPRPPPRPPRALRNRRPNANGTIMPTVELNALAMKLGEPAVYVLEPLVPEAENTHNGSSFAVSYRPQAGRPTAHTAPQVQLQSFNRNSRYYNQNNRFVNKFPNNWFKEQPAFSGMYRVRLTVGSRQFWGEGGTPQAARHDAAARALRQFRLMKDQDTCNINEGTADEDEDSEEKESCDMKSPVSMVHEIALKFNLPVTFEFKSEKGPPHMKVFVTVCSVAEHVTEGEGNSKKISKKRAAEKMLEELKKLPSVKKTVSQPEVRKPKKKPQQPKKRARNLIKEKADSNSGTETNPVSRLLQWSVEVSGAGREPVYTLVEESGRGQRRKGFVILCEVAGRKATGSGASKRLAKRSAAENVLNTIEELADKPADSVKNSGRAANVDSSSYSGKQDSPSPPTGGSSGRQLVPGLLLMQDHISTSSERFKTPVKNGVNVETTAAIAKELLRAGTSPTADALAKHELNHRIGSSVANAAPISSSVVSSSSSPQTSQVIGPKDQLLYLAQLLGFQVQFSDFPKGNHGEFLSLVSLSIDPPMVCHGGGLTTEQSHDQSARAALQHLSRMGLDNVTPHPPASQTAPVPVAQGQGIHLVPANTGGIPGILTNGITK